MISSFFGRLFPFVFIIFFIYFELAPIYFFESELVRPLMTFTTVYCWILNDKRKFRPLWLIFFGLFYDLLKDGIVGITALFFLGMYHLQNKSSGFIFSVDFKEIWIRFTAVLFLYSSLLFIANFFFEDFSYNVFKNLISFVLTIILFPLFHSVIQKISSKFGSFSE